MGALTARWMSAGDYKEIAARQQQIAAQSEVVDRLASAGRYMEANEENKKLEMMNRYLYELKKEALLVEQQRDEKKLRSTFGSTVNSFSNDWDTDLGSFERDAADVIAQRRVLS
jgi:hypothetical protein